MLLSLNAFHVKRLVFTRAVSVGGSARAYEREHESKGNPDSFFHFVLSLSEAVVWFASRDSLVQEKRRFVPSPGIELK